MKKVVLMFAIALLAALLIVGVATGVMAASGTQPEASSFIVSSGHPVI